MKIVLLLFAFTLAAEQRLSLHWLVREDIFAGLLANDKARLEKGVKTLDSVAAFYEETDVMAWRFGAETMRAVWAHEEGRTEDFRRHYSLAMTYLDRCRATAKGEKLGIPEIFEGGVYVVSADRLPESLRAGAWERAYQSYKRLNELEASRVDRLPLHMKGEVIAGLAVATQRTGRNAELSAALETVRQKLPGTVYAKAAEKWMADPESAGKVRLACLTCHEPNTLGPKLNQLHQVKK
jgi:hypothetical protein